MGWGREAPPPPRQCQHTSTRVEYSDEDGKTRWVTLLCADCGMPLRTWKE